ncbi:MAG: uracil-DNA glycosylase [Christensenellales bacterium]|nr:uracil-DNA glycosylase [Christensenellales bacterium]
MEKYQQALRAFLAGVMPGRENALVFGEGPMQPKLMLIGEAPGEQETLMGRPFVGKAGKNLDRFLELAGMQREEIFISNAVKLRPTKTGKTGRISNRPPTKEEIALFRPWLLEEIERVNPRVIATLGNVPLLAVTNDKKLTIGAAHGHVMEAGETGRPLFALYHPASLIYNRALEPVYEQDVCTLAAWLAAQP